MASKHRATLLLVDDDRHVLASMADWLRDQGYATDTAGGLAEGIAAVDRKTYDLVLVDIRLADGDGFELLGHCRRNHAATTVIMITGYGTVDSAIEAIRQGAFDFLTKPLIDEELEMAIERALSQRKVIEENRTLKAQLDLRFGMENIVGHDHRMLRIFDMIDSVADTRATVLVTGESGTGKSLIARAMHRRSSRRDKPFVEVACGALPETLLESELFGHVAGAFTGAVGEKLGKFMQADKGTIFLDEISTASPGMQVKLLRVLQDLEFEQVGGNKTFTVDTRVILATNEDLSRAVAEGRFRQDLFFRVNVINIELPPLRERISDIPLLAEHFLRRVCDDCGKPMHSFSPEAMTALQRYRWPGNVRELQNVIERAVLLGKSHVIGPDDLPGSFLTVGVGPLSLEPVGSTR
jgi:DNA-binding NtrC family response regulator